MKFDSVNGFVDTDVFTGENTIRYMTSVYRILNDSIQIKGVVYSDTIVNSTLDSCFAFSVNYIKNKYFIKDTLDISSKEGQIDVKLSCGDDLVFYHPAYKKGIIIK